MPELSEPGYACLRDALTVARSDNPPRRLKELRKRLFDAGHDDASIDEALATWAGSVVTRLMPDEVQ